MGNIHITEKEIVDYKLGDKSATLDMAIAFGMPYIVEKDARAANTMEKTLMAAELLSKYNGEETVLFLNDIVDNFEVANSTVLGVSLVTIAKTLENTPAVEYLNMFGVREQGTSEDAIKVINIFNDDKKTSSDDMLSFLVGEAKKYIK